MDRGIVPSVLPVIVRSDGDGEWLRGAQIRVQRDVVMSQSVRIPSADLLPFA